MGALRGTPVEQNLGAMYMGIAVSVEPIMLAFLFFSRYIISSISPEAVKELDLIETSNKWICI